MLKRRRSGDGLHTLRRARQVRLLVLLDAANHAGLAPISILRLHTLAYLTNVLSPVWDMPIFEGRLLKRRGSPFYPVLQGDLDRFVGLGLARVSGIKYLRDEEGCYRLDGAYELNIDMARSALEAVQRYDGPWGVRAFVREVAIALSALPNEDIDAATREDATYADPTVGPGGVVDFGEWQVRNFSANAAERVGRMLPEGDAATRGEKLHLYLRHLHTRLHGQR